MGEAVSALRVIAFYSEGTPYEEEAAILRASLNRVGMAHEITPVPDRGSWGANTLHKGQFIKAKRNEHRGPLLYVDVDAYVHENCSAYFEGLAAQGFDFGAHYFAGPAKGHDRSKVRAEGWRLLSGTLFLGDTPACKRLCSAWASMNGLWKALAIMEGGGQKNLWFLTTCLQLKIARLPGRYTYVFDKPWAYPEGEPCVIEHTIASRENRGQRGRTNAARRTRVAELRAQAGLNPKESTK